MTRPFEARVYLHPGVTIRNRCVAGEIRHFRLGSLPVLVLLTFQIKFLPYHAVATTHLHRLAILLDLILLFSVLPFIAMPHLRSKGRKLEFGNRRPVNILSLLNVRYGSKA